MERWNRLRGTGGRGVEMGKGEERELMYEERIKGERGERGRRGDIGWNRMERNEAEREEEE